MPKGKVRILRAVPVLVNGVATRLTPGDEVDGLSPDVVAALIRGGDAEEISEVPATSAPLSERLFKQPQKKNRGAAPENK